MDRTSSQPLWIVTEEIDQSMFFDSAGNPANNAVKIIGVYQNRPLAEIVVDTLNRALPDADGDGVSSYFNRETVCYSVVENAFPDGGNSENPNLWADAKAAAVNGTLRELFKSGDRIPVTLKNGEDIELDVTFDEAGKMFFVTRNCVAWHKMNNKATNQGGWKATEMRRFLNEDFFSLLPDELQSVIVPTPIVQVVDGESVVTEDKLFLLSATQVFGKNWWTEYEPEDTQLDIFESSSTRIKSYCENGVYMPTMWWLRSANTNNAFRYVYTDGSRNYHSANFSGAVALGFCINQ